MEDIDRAENHAGKGGEAEDLPGSLGEEGEGDEATGEDANEVSGAVADTIGLGGEERKGADQDANGVGDEEGEDEEEEEPSELDEAELTMEKKGGDKEKEGEDNIDQIRALMLG